MEALEWTWMEEEREESRMEDREWIDAVQAGELLQVEVVS